MFLAKRAEDPQADFNRHLAEINRAVSIDPDRSSIDFQFCREVNKGHLAVSGSGSAALAMIRLAA